MGKIAAGWTFGNGPFGWFYVSGGDYLDQRKKLPVQAAGGCSEKEIVVAIAKLLVAGFEVTGVTKAVTPLSEIRFPFSAIRILGLSI